MSFFTNPALLLRLEGIAVFVGGLWAWLALGGSWWLFALLLLSPDLSMLGYAAGSRIGATVYNLVHSYPLSAVLLALGLVIHNPSLILAGVLILAHIGWDRFLGYGLKLPTAFQDTHLGRIGHQ
ncbi:MAG: DUF4260 domain-containing protein [Thermaceae bacterium]|nr:DUF4260 domain-containing protein [Thermaceae bacterium]